MKIINNYIVAMADTWLAILSEYQLNRSLKLNL